VVVESAGTTFTDAVDATNLSISGGPSSVRIGKTTSTGNVTLGSAITAAGPISVYGGDLTLKTNLTSTLAGSAIKLMATGTITSNTAANTITTNGGAVVLASDTDGNDLGKIYSGNGLTIDTRTGLTGAKSNGGTGGGAITLGGGNQAGTGYAAVVSSTDAGGIAVDNGLWLYSGGGDIAMRGKSWAGAVGTSYQAWGIGFWSGATSLVADGWPMPRSAAIMVVDTLGTPKRLNSSKLASRMRSAVRRGAFFTEAIQVFRARAVGLLALAEGAARVVLARVLAGEAKACMCAMCSSKAWMRACRATMSGALGMPKFIKAAATRFSNRFSSLFH
jgi:hypothetical protein